MTLQTQVDARAAEWLAFWTDRIRLFWSLGTVDTARFYRNTEE